MDAGNCNIDKLGSAGRHQMILEQRFLDELEECDPSEYKKYEALEKCEGNMLLRDLKAAALRRQEEAARTEEDFNKIIEKWDKNDAARERRERYNEILRGDVPIDCGCSYSPDLKIFPKYMNSTVERQLLHGDFLDFMYDCPFEMHDLTSIDYATEIVKNLKPEHKEILYFIVLKHFKTSTVAQMRGQSDRNIRRARIVVYHKIWKQVYEELTRRQKKGTILTEQEKAFMRGYEEGTLVMDDDK